MIRILGLLGILLGLAGAALGVAVLVLDMESPTFLLEFLAPLGLIFAIVVLIKKQKKMGLAGLLLSLIGIGISPSVISGEVITQVECLVSDCPIVQPVAPVRAKPLAPGLAQGGVAAIKPPVAAVEAAPAAKPVAKANCGYMSTVIGWEKLDDNARNALGDLVVDDVSKVNRSPDGSLYYKDMVSGSAGTPVKEFIDNMLAPLKQRHPGLVTKMTEGQKTNQGQAIVIVQTGGYTDGRLEVISIIDGALEEGPCSKQVHVLSAPNQDILLKDFPAYFQKVKDVSISKVTLTDVNPALPGAVPAAAGAIVPPQAPDAPAADSVIPPAAPLAPAPVMPQ